MINIQNLSFPLSVIAGGEIVLVTDINPIKEFVDNKPTNKICGYRYSVVCPANKYQQFDVKLEQTAPVITPEELEAKGGSVKAKIKGFEGRFFKNRNGEYIFSAKATGIEVVA